jgi:transcriptional regulator NrdR family protein
MRNGFLNNLPDLELCNDKLRQEKTGNQQAKADDVKPTKRGLICPYCGHHSFETVKTIPLLGWIRRYRICKNCGRKVRTREIIEKDF